MSRLILLLAEATELAHVLAHVVKVVVKREGPRLPLVGTGLVLPRLASLVLCGVLIFVDLS